MDNFRRLHPQRIALVVNKLHLVARVHWIRRLSPRAFAQPENQSVKYRCLPAAYRHGFHSNMGNALRLFVFCLALVAVGTTAALSQLWLNHQALTRQQATDASPAPFVLRAYQRDQKYALGLVVTVTLISLLAVAVVGVNRPTPPVSADHINRSRHAMKQVEHFAKTTVAQEAALSLERAERQRSEENLHLQQLLLNQALAEKIHLGRDLHDGVIQSLYATGLTLESARQKQTTDPVAADALFDRGIQLLNQSIRELRSYIQPPTEASANSDLVFSKALDVLLANLKGEREVTFLIHIDERAEAQLDPTQLTETLQIVRESVSNALRHGAATQLQIRLHEEGTQLALLVQDNGTGFNTATLSTGGHGLANLRARATALGADFKLDSHPGRGTRVALTFSALNHS